MPNYQRQFRNLLPFLTELHQSGLPAVWVQQFSNPDENLAILLADSTIHNRDRPGNRAIAIHAPGTGLSRIPAISGHRDAVVVLLLGGRGGDGGSVDLDILLGEMRVLSLMRMLLGLVLLVLMLQPRRIRLWILVLVGKDMLGLRLEHCGRVTRKSRRDTTQGELRET